MRYLLALVALVIVLLACAPQAPTCAAPYIANGETCCLDRDGNGACDIAENASALTAQSGLDCSLCPPNFIVEKQDVIVYRYVCGNGSIMTDATQCEVRIASNAHLFSVVKDEDPTYVKTFDVRPACRGLFRAVEVHIDPEKIPRGITIEIKDQPEGEYRNLLFIDGNKEVLDDKYAYIGLCDDPDCSKVTDAQVNPAGAFVIRATLQYTESETMTRERLIDPTSEGDYGTQKC